MERVKDFLGTIFSILIAILRLFALAVCFLTSGLQIIIFTRTEICNVEMRGQPFRCDKHKMDENLSYVDKLMLENPDLLNVPEREDSLFSEEDIRTMEDIMNDEDRDDNDMGI